MNIQDRLAEIFLSFFDRIMDLLSFGWWTEIRGDQVPNIHIKK
jgi:hypothetical protein